MKFFIVLLFSFQVSADDGSKPAPAKSSMPGNEIWLFDITEVDGTTVSLSTGKNITNHPGYDSQPRFSRDGAIIYYTREVKSDSGSQTDIYQYHLSDGKTTPYMTTSESEYSPTIGYEEPDLTVVQVDKDNNQYIVHLDRNAPADKQVNRFSDLKQVGYFNWTSGYKLWSFVLNESGGGDLVHMGKSKKPTVLVENVGRTFVTDNESKLIYYVDKNTTPWRIKSRQRKLHDSIDVMALPEGVEDFTLDSKNRFWAGKNQDLFVSFDQKTWKKIKSFDDEQLSGISRLTTSPNADKIAIVFAE